MKFGSKCWINFSAKQNSRTELDRTGSDLIRTEPNQPILLKLKHERISESRTDRFCLVFGSRRRTESSKFFKFIYLK